MCFTGFVDIPSISTVPELFIYLIFRNLGLLQQSNARLLFLLGLIFIPTQRGKQMVLYNGFTYDHTRLNAYYCTKRRVTNCKANVKLGACNDVAQVFEIHNHEPPTIHRTKSGKHYIQR